MRPGWPGRETVIFNATRSLLVVVVATTFFYALSVLPLAEAIALSFVSPLFMVLFGVLLLGERIDSRIGIAIAAGLAGMLLIAGSAHRRCELLVIRLARCARRRHVSHGLRPRDGSAQGASDTRPAADDRLFPEPRPVPDPGPSGGLCLGHAKRTGPGCCLLRSAPLAWRVITSWRRRLPGGGGEARPDHLRILGVGARCSAICSSANGRRRRRLREPRSSSWERWSLSAKRFNAAQS